MFCCVSRSPKPTDPPTGGGLYLFCWCVLWRQLLSIDSEHGEVAEFDDAVTKRIEHRHVDVAVG